MANFIFNTRDQKFILTEWLNMEQIFSYEKYNDSYGVDDIEMVIGEAYKMCRDIIAPSNEDGDQNPAHLVDGVVVVPESMKKAYEFVNENGWGSGNIADDAGFPEIFQILIGELMLGANPAFAPYVGTTTGSANLIKHFGSEEVKEMFLDKMLEGTWAGTMDLTEPNYGSDVGDITSKAFPTDTPGKYKIKGTKCFITGGDHNMTENIIHLALARVEGAAPGTKGLSLFVVPKNRFDENGEITGSNDLITVAVEHKLGLRGSATAMLNYGDNDDCYGYILGEAPGEDGRGQGIAQMFQLMNAARIETGLMANSVAAVAYYNAAQYSKERIQGRLVTDLKGDRVPINKHADVRRMLLNMKAHVEACRAMIYKIAFDLDVEENDPDEAKRAQAKANVEVTTPLVKAYASDVAWPLIADAIQVYGGYGFSEEYPVAQSARDVKIYSIWEGTNYIQAMDLLARKMPMNNGEMFQAWKNELRDMIKKVKEVPEFEKEAQILDEGFKALKSIQRETIKFFMQKQIDLLPVYATRILHVVSKVYCGALITDQALLATKKIAELGEDHPDYAFYRGKVEAARYYVRNIVPEVHVTAKLITDPDSSVLDIPEECFEF